MVKQPHPLESGSNKRKLQRKLREAQFPVRAIRLNFEYYLDFLNLNPYFGEATCDMNVRHLMRKAEAVGAETGGKEGRRGRK